MIRVDQMSVAQLNAHLEATGKRRPGGAVGKRSTNKKPDDLLDGEVGRFDATAGNIYQSPPGFSLLQPWAQLLACGAKTTYDVETYTGYRGRVFFYASPYTVNADSTLEQYPALADALDARRIARLPGGALVGSALLTKVYRLVEEPAPSSDWRVGLPRPETSREVFARMVREAGPYEHLGADLSPGRFLLEFTEAELLAEPIPLTRLSCRGLFVLPGAVLEQLRPLFS